MLASGAWMDAQFHLPRSLGPLVHAIWEQRSETPMAWQILPSGRVELIFNLGPALEDVRGKRIDATFNPTERFCFLSGLHTRPLRMSFPRFHVMGVQMQPLAIRALFGVPSVEVRDWAVPGEEILADLAAVEDRLRGPGAFMDKAEWLEAWLRGRLTGSPELRTALSMRRAVDRMLERGRAGERVRPEDWTGYSRMHTHRLFKDWMGLAPGEFLRLERFVRMLRRLHATEDDLTTIAQQSGYYDQAHLNHHFQRFAGMAPGRYRAGRTALPGQLSI